MRSDRASRSARVHAAVDIERSTGDESVVLAGEKYRGTCDVVGVAAAAERDAGDRGFGGLGRRVRVVKAGAENHAGRERIDAHALGSELVGQSTRKCED